MIRRILTSNDWNAAACRRWYERAMEAHAAFAAADMAETEYRVRLRSLGMRRPEVELEVGLHKTARNGERR